MALSYKALLNKGVAELKNSDEALFDAQVLLAHATGKDKAWLVSHANDSANCEAEYLALIKQRQTGIPVAYIIGSAGFWDFELQVTSDTLIPRPETELLIETAIQKLPSNTANILDLGTGSGAIAIALARHFNQANVVASDQSLEALEVAEQNAKRLNAANINFRNGSWLEVLNSNETFNLIASNPPYIDASEPELKQLQHEPQSALIAADKGLADIKIITSGALDHLNKNGWLMIEHGYQQAVPVQQLFTENGFQHVETIYDYANHPRITIGQKQN